MQEGHFIVKRRKVCLCKQGNIDCHFIRQRKRN